MSMRTVFHKDTGKYLGNIADSRAMDDPTLPKHLRGGHVAVGGEFTRKQKLDLATREVRDDADWSPPPPPRDLLAELDALKARNEKLEAALAAKSIVTKAEIDAVKERK